MIGKKDDLGVFSNFRSSFFHTVLIFKILFLIVYINVYKILYTYYLYFYIIIVVFNMLLNSMEKKQVPKKSSILPDWSYTLKNT